MKTSSRWTPELVEEEHEAMARLEDHHTAPDARRELRAERERLGLAISAHLHGDLDDEALFAAAEECRRVRLLWGWAPRRPAGARP